VLSIGDKTVTFSALTTGAGQQGSITFLNSVQDFFALKTNFLDSALLAPATGTLAYKVNIVSGLQTFKGVQLSVDAFGSTTLVKSETSPGGPRFNTLTSLNSTSPIPSASLFEPVNFTGLTELAVLDVFTLVNPSSLSSFTNTFQQSPINVPGPLPVMGAGIAFGFSRKLRGWIKASATV
jgi:hypothetical protein